MSSCSGVTARMSQLIVVGIICQTGYDEKQWTYVSDSLLCIYRKGLRDGMYVIDKSVDAGVTWENIRIINPEEETIIMSIDAGVTGFRQEVRLCALRIDQELTPLGFAGIENTDWEEIIYIG
jgi:hypothetical protein